MATILLRRATQIANRIKTQTQFEVENDEYSYRRRSKKLKTLNPHATVSIDGNPSQRISMLRDTLLSRKEEMTRLIDIGSRLRQAIAIKQAQCGVSELVTQRVGLVNKQKVLEFLIEATENGVLDTNEIEDRMHAMRSRLANATAGAATAEISTVLLTEQDRNRVQTELSGTKRELLDVDDRLAQLNSSNSVEISDEDEGYLRDLSIA